jgi:hypothetical protein
MRAAEAEADGEDPVDSAALVRAQVGDTRSDVGGDSLRSGLVDVRSVLERLAEVVGVSGAAT